MKVSTNPLTWFRGTALRYSRQTSGDVLQWRYRDRQGRIQNEYHAIRLDDAEFLGKILGMRAGPKIAVSNLVHEMAHFVETEEHRFWHRGYGLRVRQVECLGRMYDQPETAQCTLREIRVWGIQAVLGRYFGINDCAPEDLAPVSVWMSDHCAAMDHFGCGYSDNDKMTSRERERLYFQRVAAAIREESEKHSVSDLYEKWRHRCAIHDSLIGKKSSELFPNS